jgi:heme A synthase
MAINSEDIFTIANIIFTIGTARLFLQVIRNRDTLKDFDFTGSVLTMVAILVMIVGFFNIRMYVSLLFIIPTMAFWAFVSMCGFSQYLKRKMARGL